MRGYVLNLRTKKDTFQYHCIEGRPKTEILQEFVGLNQRIFLLNERKDDIEKLFEEQKTILGCYTFVCDLLIAFKIGFENEPHVFESWRRCRQRVQRAGDSHSIDGITASVVQNKSFSENYNSYQCKQHSNDVIKQQTWIQVVQHTTNHRNIQKYISKKTYNNRGLFWKCEKSIKCINQLLKMFSNDFIYRFFNGFRIGHSVL